jgi:hypothetical protein
MSDLFKNGIVQGVLAAIIVALILGVFGWIKFKRDEKIVTEFLKNTGVETSHTFRTTHAISSATDLSKERIRNVCSKSSMIKRNQKEKESWKLSI